MIEPLPAMIVVIASIAPAIAAAVLLALLPRFTKRPFTAFWVISAVALWLSTYGPSGTPTDSEATVMGLELDAHDVRQRRIVGAFSGVGAGGYGAVVRSVDRSVFSGAVSLLIRRFRQKKIPDEQRIRRA